MEKFTTTRKNKKETSTGEETRIHRRKSHLITWLSVIPMFSTSSYAIEQRTRHRQGEY